MTAPPKNTNAVKSTNGTATSFLHIRCTPEDKARWVKRARGLPLAEWVIAKLNASAGGSPSPSQSEAT